MMEFSASTTPVELSAWADKVFAGEVTQAVRSEPVPNPYENKARFVHSETLRTALLACTSA